MANRRGARNALRLAYICRMQLDLSDDEQAALARLLRSTIENDRYPMAPRLRPLKAILARLDPQPEPEPLPPPRPAGKPSTILSRAKRRPR